MNGRPEFHKRPKLGRERNGSFLTFLLETGQSGNGPVFAIFPHAKSWSSIWPKTVHKRVCAVSGGAVELLRDFRMENRRGR